jgi:hypothetical protein
MRTTNILPGATRRRSCAMETVWQHDDFHVAVRTRHALTPDREQTIVLATEHTAKPQ